MIGAVGCGMSGREKRELRTILVGARLLNHLRLIDSHDEESEAFQTVRWVGDAATGFLRLIDQTRLPTEFVEIDCRDVPAVWEAIKLLRVRVRRLSALRRPMER